MVPILTGSKTTFEQWRVLFLLALSVSINYIDRGSLSVGAPAMTAELSLTPTQMGLLFSSFFWTYASFQPIAGWLVDRYNVRWLLAAAFFLWSAATFGFGFAHSLQALFVLRLLLGIGESVAFPAYSKVIATGFLIHQRGLPNALIDAGLKVGPGLGTLLGGLIVAKLGWRALFFILGLGGMIWLFPWFLWAPRDRALGPRGTSSDGPGFLQILRKRDAWGTFIGNFCNNYAFYFLLTWLPSYLVMERHLSMEKMAILGSLPFWASAISSVLAGWASDRWIARGASPTRVRKTFVVSGMLLAMFMFPAAILPNLWVSMGLLMAAYVGFGLVPSNLWAITQTCAGPLAAGKWTGLQNGIANLAGVVAPYVTGLIVTNSGSFYSAFLSASLILVGGAAAYVFVVGKVSPIVWSSEDEGTTKQRVRGPSLSNLK